MADNFVVFVIAFAALTAAAWTFDLFFLRLHPEIPCGVCFILERFVGVLVASCPCALGLAVPSVISIALNMAVKEGILIRKNSVF